MAFTPLIPKVALLIFAVLLLISAAEDARRLIIPNRYCLAIAFLYPAYVLSTPVAVDWPAAAAVAAAALAIGFVCFLFRVAGGGDVKLFAATTLWAGPSLFPNFLLVTSLIGAGIALVVLARRRLGGALAVSPRRSAGLSPAPAAAVARVEAQAGAPPIPYGVAIAAGGLHVAVTLFLKG